jgi:hypothetical protein
MLLLLLMMIQLGLDGAAGENRHKQEAGRRAPLEPTPTCTTVVYTSHPHENHTLFVIVIVAARITTRLLLLACTHTGREPRLVNSHVSRYART